MSTQQSTFRQRVNRIQFTELNVTTTLRYLACGDDHVNSGETIERDLGHFYICSRCEVPIQIGVYRPGMIRLGRPSIDMRNLTRDGADAA